MIIRVYELGGISEDTDLTQRSHRGRTQSARRIWKSGEILPIGSSVQPGTAVQSLGGAEVEMGVELFFEKVGTAFGVANVFGGVAADAQLHGHGAALERGF